MDSDSEDISRDFSKISRNADVNGYREGLMDETEQLLQKRFDSGYTLGIQLGFTSGFYNALSKSVLQEQQNISKDVIELAKSNILQTDLKNVIEENCQMCLNESEEKEKSFNNIYNEQKIVNDKLIESINKKNLALLNELNIDSDILNEFNK